MAALFESIEKGLESWGFDLCQPFSIEDYNDNVSDIYKIPSMGHENTLAILVGNSRNIWPTFISSLAEDIVLYKNENPLDQYTKQAIDFVVSKIHTRSRVFFSSEIRVVPFLNFQLIAEISGMCKRSYNSKMCYHHQFGHWIGLRAVIVLDYTYVYNLSTKHIQDFEICSNCDELYGQQLDLLCRDKSMLNRYRDPMVWRSWLALRTVCKHNANNYSYEQACYHYSKNHKVLESEVKRIKDGHFKPEYEWLDEYSKDPKNYRIGDFK